jgi:amino acid transporter
MACSKSVNTEPERTGGAVDTGSSRRHIEFKPVLSLWALVAFGLTMVGPTAPYAFFGIGSVLSHGHFAAVYLIAILAVSFTAVSYARMAKAFPEAGSTYAYASRTLHPVVGYFAGWGMLLDYVLTPMLSVIIISVTARKLVPAMPYAVWVLLGAGTLTAVNLCGIEMTSRTTIVFNVVLVSSVSWFVVAAVRALLHGVGAGHLISLEPFYHPQTFSVRNIMAASPIAVLSFLGFDGISTLAEDAKVPERNVGRATILVCFVAGVLFVLQTYLGQLVWPDYRTFSPVETAFSDIGRLVGGQALFLVIAFSVVAQVWAGGMTAQASASRLLVSMAREGRMPYAVFGYVHPKLRTPIYSVLLMGGIAVIGGLALNLNDAAQLVNFGACLGFMAVNAATMRHYYFRLRQRSITQFWSNIVCPGLGLVICFYVWLNISHAAAQLGAAWTALGLVYLTFLTRGFRRKLAE